MIRIAAVGDLHIGTDPDPELRRALLGAVECADALLLAGDLTRHGSRAEAAVISGALRGSEIPVVAVLGNHDHHADEPWAVVAELESAGVVVLEGGAVVLDTPGGRLGVAGVKGFGGGFAGASATEFGEPEMKAFVRHTREVAQALRASLAALACDVRVALLHYGPVPDTLSGEAHEIYPFLGSYLLAEAIDEAGADLAVHGHAHKGSEQGVTPGGVHVRNVAQPVIRAPFRIFEVSPREPAWRSGVGPTPRGARLAASPRSA